MTTLPRRRRIRDGAIAIDLGTARTQIFLSQAGIVLDEPTLTAYSVSGEVIAAGRDAWVASEVGAAQLRMPVRGGVVRDPVGCVHTVRLLLSAGDLLVGWQLLRQAEIALAKLDGQASAKDQGFYQGKVAVASFFAKSVLPELTARRAIVEAADNDLMEIPETAF